jgi:hypothetical protein
MLLLTAWAHLMGTAVMAVLLLLSATAPYWAAWLHPTQRRRRREHRVQQRLLRDAQRALRWKQEVQAFALAQWQTKHWWRMEPAEGWQVGFNCDPLPPAAHEHIQKHGRIVPPTYAEVYRDMGVA